MATGNQSRIRIMLTADAVGGVWNYTLSLAEGLVEAGCSCVIVLLGPAATPSQREAAAGSEIKLVESGLDLDWLCTRPADLTATSRDLAHLARRLEADLAHVHSPMFATPAWTIPVIAVAHSCTATWWDAVRGGEMPEFLVWRRDAMSAGMAVAHSVVAPTHAFASALERVYGKIATLRVVHNGVQPSSRPSRNRARPGYVMSAGRLWDVGKNMTALDEAAGLQPAPVILAGSVSGPDGSAFAASHATMPGVLSGEVLRQAYRQASIFASPSLYEPFGLAVLEAASLGVPLLLADIPTFRELWQDAAIFVPPRESARWAHSISLLMGDEDRLGKLGEAAWQRSLRFQRQDMVDKTLELHRGVLAGRALESADR